MFGLKWNDVRRKFQHFKRKNDVCELRRLQNTNGNTSEIPIPCIKWHRITSPVYVWDMEPRKLVAS